MAVSRARQLAAIPREIFEAALERRGLGSGLSMDTDSPLTSFLAAAVVTVLVVLGGVGFVSLVLWSTGWAALLPDPLWTVTRWGAVAAGSLWAAASLGFGAYYGGRHLLDEAKEHLADRRRRRGLSGPGI